MTDTKTKTLDHVRYEDGLMLQMRFEGGGGRRREVACYPSIFIGEGTKEGLAVYKAEETATEALSACAAAMKKLFVAEEHLLGHVKSVYDAAMPQALLGMLDRFESATSYTAAVGYLRAQTSNRSRARGIDLPPDVVAHLEDILKEWHERHGEEVVGARDATGEAPKKRVLVAYRDSSTIARAWATGPEEKLDAVKVEAKHQLNAYIEKKRDLGDPLADGDFVCTVQVLP